MNETSDLIQSPDAFKDIEAETVPGGVILSRTGRNDGRRVLFVSSYGGPAMWHRIRAGLVPTHHFWGCVELLSKGYTVLIAEPLKHFSFRGRILPHDLKYHRFIADWLRPDDIIFSAHTLLYWVPLLHHLGYRRRNIVSLTYAREKLDFPGAHRGIVALTPAAADQAKRMAPQARVAMLGWGADLRFFPSIAYNPQFFLSCGRTQRDFQTLARGVGIAGHPTSILSAPSNPLLLWPQNATCIQPEKSSVEVPFADLLSIYYANCSASIIALNEDPVEKTAVGLTAAIEAMAMSRPIILSNTGAAPGALEVERRKCGMLVPPNDPQALADAMNFLHANPGVAEEMGAAGRRHCQDYFNINRYAADLHTFFQSL